MNVCFDCCALNRLFDAPTPRVNRERAGMKVILAMLHGGRHKFALTDVLMYEVRNSTDLVKRADLLNLLPGHDLFVPGSTDLKAEALTLARAVGLDTTDALHVASAAAVEGILFTTDDRILKIADMLPVAFASATICNPAEWAKVLKP
ncbi:MAG: PIN domain-containing protein [Planctomycetes bacterium]|nr:PIN domain-containing protein [Planctomycetota bacterium]